MKPFPLLVAVSPAVAMLAATASATAQTSGLQAAKKRAAAVGPQGNSQRRVPSGLDAPDEGPVPSALAADAGPPPPGLIDAVTDLRARLAQRGIGVSARYISEGVYNLSGGDRRVYREAGSFDAGVLLEARAAQSNRRAYQLRVDTVSGKERITLLSASCHGMGNRTANEG